MSAATLVTIDRPVSSNTLASHIANHINTGHRVTTFVTEPGLGIVRSILELAPLMTRQPAAEIRCPQIESLEEALLALDQATSVARESDQTLILLLDEHNRVRWTGEPKFRQALAALPEHIHAVCVDVAGYGL